MTMTELDSMAIAALAAVALGLGWLAHKRSARQQPIHGGALSSLFSMLSAACLAAILPTALMMVLVWHPAHVQMLSLVWHPLVLAVLALGLGSLAFSLLHAIVERGPLERARAEEARAAQRGWTEADAKSSGL